MTETQNVSAQIFTKQLPPSEKATYYGCKNDFYTDNLTTCVDYIDSDTAIENAFQKQLDLSDYYKGRSIFETIKRDFMDQTMEKTTDEVRFPPQSVRELSQAVPNVTVGPRDRLFESTENISFFGPSGGNMLLTVGVIFVVMMFLIKIKK